MPKRRWYGKGFHHLVMEIPVSECQCGNGVSGFGAFLKGFLQERINATPMHLRKDEDGTALHLLRDRGALRSEKNILTVQGRGRCPSAPVARGVPRMLRNHDGSQHGTPSQAALPQR